MDLQLGHAEYHRSVAKEARIQTRNRFYEANPILTKNTALISRPGLRRWLEIGDGPIRALHSTPGSFLDALFVVSANSWYRLDKTAQQTLLTTGLASGGQPSMAGTGTIGDGAGATPEYMYLADGRNLWLYIANGYARGTISGSPADGDVIQVGSVWYKFTSGSVNAEAPAGTMANPWLVKFGFNDTASWQNFGYAIGALGTAGTTYSTALAANPDASAQTIETNAVGVRAVAVGAAGNAVTTTETGAAIAWGAATLQDGGGAEVTTVDTPNGVGIVSVAYIAGYIVCIPAQGNDFNGRFYWINPGETTIDPLDFATAERSPDPVFQVVVFGDQFWLPGSNTTEVWYFTGNLDQPVLRLQGITFDRGTWEGTALQVKESMIIVDSDGGVFQIQGGLNRISNPAIEETIRAALAYQASRNAV